MDANEGSTVNPNKEAVRCIAVVGGLRIEGDVHVLTGSRLTDTLNSRSKDFIVMTDPVIRDAVTGDEITRPPYVAVNRVEAAVVYPIE